MLKKHYFFILCFPSMIGQITIYTTAGCPHCLHSKQILKNHELEFVEVSVNKFPNVQTWLREKTGKTSVPQIFFNNIHIGGNQELQFAVKNEEKWTKLLQHLQKEQKSELLIPQISEIQVSSSEMNTFSCEKDPAWKLAEQFSLSGVAGTRRSCFFTLRGIDKAFTSTEFINWYIQSNESNGSNNSHEVSEDVNVLKKEALEEGQKLLEAKFILPVKVNEASKYFTNDSKILYKLNFGSKNEALNAGTPPSNCRIDDTTSVAELLRETALQLYSEFLSSDGKYVDYAAMANSAPFRQLEFASVSLRRASLEQLELEGANAVTAFFLNAYNALVIHARGARPPASNFFTKMKFFSETRYVIGGLTFSLNDMENGVLRANKGHPYFPGPQFGHLDPRLRVSLKEVDPRIHFALNCGANSCPPIKTYSAQKLDSELDLATWSFLESSEVLSPTSDGLKLSPIFRWYASDFGGAARAVVEWIGRHLPSTHDCKMHIEDLLANEKKIRLQYSNYDWGSNDVKSS